MSACVSTSAIRWWAVWLTEMPEEGSLHFRARTEAEAISKARRMESFQTEDGEEPLELSASRVTAQMHRAWRDER